MKGEVKLYLSKVSRGKEVVNERIEVVDYARAIRSDELEGVRPWWQLGEHNRVYKYLLLPRVARLRVATLANIRWFGRK